MDNPMEEPSEVCWCGRDLNEDGDCPVHDSVKTSAEERPADPWREYLNEDDDGD